MRKQAALALFVLVLLNGGAAATSLGPQETAIIAYTPTDTVQERVNVTSWENDSVQENLTGWHYEPGPNTYVFDAVNVSGTKTVQEGKVTQVNISATLTANNLTNLLTDYQACKLDNKKPNPCNASKYVDRYNKWYYYNGGNLSNTSQLDALLDSATQTPFNHVSGSLLDYNVNGDVTKESVTVSATYSFTDADRARFKIGNQSQSFTMSTQTDWTDGTFNGTSADRADNSGILGIGYQNETVTDNLIGFWRMDRTSGDMLDYSGDGNDGKTYNLNRGKTGIFSTQAYGFPATTSPDSKADIPEYGEFSAYTNLYMGVSARTQ